MNILYLFMMWYQVGESNLICYFPQALASLALIDSQMMMFLNAGNHGNFLECGSTNTTKDVKIYGDWSHPQHKRQNKRCGGGMLGVGSGVIVDIQLLSS